MCWCVRARKRERVYVFMCVFRRERIKMCMCERERKSVCVREREKRERGEREG